MSSSKTKVEVVSADPFAEVSLVDSHYRVRASGIGVLDYALPPGLYVARVRSGDVTRQQSLRITPDSREKQSINFGEVGPLRSSAPAEPSLDLAMVAQAAQAVGSLEADGAPTDPGQQGWVLLALTGSAPREQSTDRSPLPADAANGFALYWLDGKMAHDLGSVPPTLTPSGHQAIAVPAGPGWYALAIPIEEGRRLLLPLRVQSQWSPSVFLELRGSGDDRRLNFDTMLVSYDPAEWGIYRNPTRLRAMEQARRALARGHGAPAPGVMSVLYEQKFEDPMLGLMAVALLLNAGKPSTELGKVLKNTGRLLGHDHPDLVISRAVARRDHLVPDLPQQLGDDTPLVAPPLLRANWERLLGLKERKDELLDREGPLYAVARSQFKAEVWMLWWADPAEEARVTTEGTGKRPRAVSRPADGADTLLAQLMEKWGAGTSLDASAVQAWYRENRTTLIPLERSVLRACIQLAQLEPGRRLPKGFAGRLAAAAEVPLPVLKETLGGLMGRLEAEGTPSSTFIADGERLKTR